MALSPVDLGCKKYRSSIRTKSGWVNKKNKQDIYMKLRLDVAAPSPQAWIESVMANFDEFLIDHAENERKAQAMALSFIAKYPNRTKIISSLIKHAIEEMEHFRDVYSFMEERGLELPSKIPEDKYAKELMKLCRTGRDERFLDRLCIASVIEVRGGERFRLVEEALEEGALKEFYKLLWRVEARHGDVFVQMALEYFDKETVYERLNYFNAEEARVMARMEIRPTMH
jgi:tRNA-(ms[2]io[6]A)-hydroxylase